MDLVTIARLGSLLRATIVDYTILHEKIGQITAIGEELGRATPEEYPEISKRYLEIMESYLIVNSILKLQYKNLQEFAREIADQATVKNHEIIKERLELMRLDIEYMNVLPVLRKIVVGINEVLTSSGTLMDETLTMVGVVKDGEIRV